MFATHFSIMKYFIVQLKEIFTSVTILIDKANFLESLKTIIAINYPEINFINFFACLSVTSAISFLHFL